MGSIGISGIVLLVLIALLLFGPNKLPELGRAFGRTLREFKKGTSDLMDDDQGRSSRKVVVSSGESEQSQVAERRLPE